MAPAYDSPTTGVGPANPEKIWAAASFRIGSNWWVFCALVFAIKLLLVWLDPRPKLFMGDSGSYMWTALTGWIPPDRSYFYGYLVRWFAVWPHTFTPLLIAQALASGVTAIVFALICSRLFEMANGFSFFFGWLCSLDPCQLVWERYVMTETFSLLIYVLVVYMSLSYLRHRRLWQLAVVQVLSLLLIGFRMSYLPVVQVCTILLPVIAFLPCALPAFWNRSRAQASRAAILTTGSAHLAASIAMMLVMHGVYKQVNGRLMKREAAYIYETGAHLVAVWAPALQPSDATDPRFAELIAKGRQFKIQRLGLRDAQQYGKGFLVDLWSGIEPSVRKRDRIARKTAMNALRRRPLQIAELAVRTYMGYCGIQSMQANAKTDLGYSELTDEQIQYLAEKFGFVTQKKLPAQPLSVLQRYYLAAWPYYFVVILSPLVCALAIFVARHRAFAFLLFVHASILIVVVTALSPRASVRYLHPISLLTLLSIALCFERFARRSKSEFAPVRAALEQ